MDKLTLERFPSSELLGPSIMRLSVLQSKRTSLIHGIQMIHCDYISIVFQLSSILASILAFPDLSQYNNMSWVYIKTG